jgi:RimJ/RimL family protein N-acetyltransferase
MGHPLTLDDWPPRPIRTERLVLRAPEARDREAFLDLYSDERVTRYLGGPRDRAELDELVPAVPAAHAGNFVAEREDRFVGWVVLNRREAERPGRVATDGLDLEVSYELSPSAWGHGYATEAVGAVLGWAAEQLPEPVVLCTQSANTRSVALAGRLGFTELERFEEFGAEQWFGVRRPPTPA